MRRRYGNTSDLKVEKAMSEARREGAKVPRKSTGRHVRAASPR